MLDHVLLDFIGSLREALEGALLEQQAVEERFQVDVFLGDISFETSYSLPGEKTPPVVRVDISLEWPTWSQSAFRSWSIGEPPAERPELIVEVALRLQRLSSLPDARVVLSALGNDVPQIGGQSLERTGPNIEQVYEKNELTPSCAIEVAYQGSYRLEDAILEEPAKIDADVAGLARWIASGLVRLADLDLPVLASDGDTLSG